MQAGSTWVDGWSGSRSCNIRDLLPGYTPTLAVALKLIDPQQQAAVKLRHMALAYVHQNSWLARPANHSAGRCLQTR